MRWITKVESGKARSRKRAAVYCQVGTDKEDQLDSLENQMKSFQLRIQQNKDWNLVNIYTDMYNQRLIQYPTYGSVGKWLKQRLSADLDVLPKALLFYTTIWRSGCKNSLNPIRSQNKNVYKK